MTTDYVPLKNTSEFTHMSAGYMFYHLGLPAYGTFHDTDLRLAGIDLVTRGLDIRWRKGGVDEPFDLSKVEADGIIPEADVIHVFIAKSETETAEGEDYSPLEKAISDTMCFEDGPSFRRDLIGRRFGDDEGEEEDGSDFIPLDASDGWIDAPSIEETLADIRSRQGDN